MDTRTNSLLSVAGRLSQHLGPLTAALDRVAARFLPAGTAKGFCQSVSDPNYCYRVCSPGAFWCLPGFGPSRYYYWNGSACVEQCTSCIVTCPS